MKKNVASQVIGAQMITAADGSAFTGSVTVSVTGNGGTQATGSVGSGACTHEGNGFHTYAPAQAETNYDHVAFTFTGTGAIPVTIQVYPTFPQTGDNYARIGAPAGASVSADIAAIKSDTAAILVDTGTTLDGRIPAALVGGRMDVSVGAMAANVLTASAINADAITAAKVAADVTTEIQSGLATAANLATLTAYVDTEVAAILAAVDTEVAAIKAVTDLLPDAGALTSLATAANLATVDTVVDAIKAVTDLLPNGGALTNLDAAISTRATPAQVNAEVVDALATDTYPEPTGVPAATASLSTKLGVLHMALRNRVDVTATKKTFYDDGGAAEWEKDLSDDGTTYSESESNAI